jgi:hypothetical protein
MIDGFLVFWMQREKGHHENGVFPHGQWFAPNEMSAALRYMEILRSSASNHFVTMASQNSNSVGKPGVDTIAGGKTPDGVDYEWSKAGRAGKTKRSERATLITKEDEK